MRVIAGTARGRPLTVPPGRDVRPTSDKVREAMFSSLGDVVAGAHVLDLFAGSGALGIEALSRGARHAVLVERSPRAVAAIRQNLARTGLAERARVVTLDAARFCRRPGGHFGLVLADPPYAEPLATVYALLGMLHDAGALAPGATVVVERHRRDAGPQPPPFLAPRRERTYGDTLLRYLQLREEAPD
ncbi:16S rRNA (guanine(966)-N(2))-methyltransferase RsmD [soil metagenome]